MDIRKAYVANKNRYDSMEYRKAGESGLYLPAISLGLWHNFGERNSQEQMQDILREAFDLGITHFDLANNYGPPMERRSEISVFCTKEIFALIGKSC